MKLKHTVLTSIAIGAAAFTLTVLPPAYAAEPVQQAETGTTRTHEPASAAAEPQHRINVDGTVLEQDSKKPLVIYVQGQPLVALRAVSEALGYKVSWNGDTKTTTIDMPIAALFVRPDAASVERKGKLTNINLDTSESLLPAPQLVDGTMYITPNAFKLLLNDVYISRDEISIAPQRSELQTGTSNPASRKNGVETFLPAEEDKVIPYEDDTTSKNDAVKTKSSKKKTATDEPLIKVKKTDKK